MERLTYKNNLGEAYLEYGADAIWKKCEAYDVLKNAISKLAEYEDLEEHGRLIKLPCKVGDTVYFIDDGEIYWDKVNCIELRKGNGEFVFCIGFMDYKEDDFGKIAFATKEKAEKALAEMKGE